MHYFTVGEPVQTIQKIGDLSPGLSGTIQVAFPLVDLYTVRFQGHPQARVIHGRDLAPAGPVAPDVRHVESGTEPRSSMGRAG